MFVSFSSPKIRRSITSINRIKKINVQQEIGIGRRDGEGTFTLHQIGMIGAKCFLTNISMDVVVVMYN